MKRYRMYLGSTDRDGVRVPDWVLHEFFNQAKARLENFTMFGATGVFRGDAEHTHVIEYIGDPLERPKVDTLAELYASMANQDSVLVTAEYISDDEFEFISNPDGKRSNVRA